MSHLLLQGDVRRLPLADNSIHCCVTSPPYFGLRSYLPDGHPRKHLEIGLEGTPDEFVAAMVAVFREVKRVLRDDGTCWLNLGDSYTSGGRSGHGNITDTKQVTNAHAAGVARPGLPDGLKPKDLIGIPWRVAFALQAEGWYLRSDIIWQKPNTMPESVEDRPTKSHEYVFLLTKSPRYFFDAEAVKEEGAGRKDLGRMTSPARLNQGGPWVNTEKATAGRNIRSVWTIATAPYKGAHFATFPPKLVEPCIKAGCPVGGIVLDPFNGSGTTGVVATALNRHYVGVDLSDEYMPMAARRISRPHAVAVRPAREESFPLFAKEAE